ncbi:hypothetical protein QR685DRAFT_451518 [Neurospora intermedia]|uniref:Uncharacterized protein n=1 Tax=Neurospora intermedia TaxID=5142 RepID=A0ABR3D0V1_NEUIN
MSTIHRHKHHNNNRTPHQQPTQQPSGPPGPHPNQWISQTTTEESTQHSSSAQPQAQGPKLLAPFIRGSASGQPLRAGLGTATAVTPVHQAPMPVSVS